MRTTVTISIDHETLADLDAFGARMAKKRGAAIRELLNMAAGAERPLPGELNDRHRLPNGKPLPVGVTKGLGGGVLRVKPRELQPGERVVDPFTEEEG